MTTALYSALYSAALPYFEDFLASLDAQTDADFELWLSLDAVDEQQIRRRLGDRPAQLLDVTGKNVASARDISLQRVCEHSDIVILVDSDDLLLPERVASAKRALENAQIYGCALELMNAQAQALGLRFGLESPPPNWRDFLTKVNVFGLSNTAYRSETLASCLGLPADVRAVDWLLITRALWQGASLTFDSEPHMRYRQYPTNTAKVIAPYSPEDLHKATELVLNHYAYVLNDINSDAHRIRQTQAQTFAKTMQHPAKRQLYLEALNRHKKVFYWWECVAQPELEALWT